MNLDPRKSEYSLISHSPIKYAESQTLHDEVEAFLAKGGEIKVLSNKMTTFISPCFDKSKEQLAAAARKNRRTLFLFHCQRHGISQHRVINLLCVKCWKEKGGAHG
ncbi:MAG: hypothetical protein RSB22_07765 [Acinetobacter sp.]